MLEKFKVLGLSENTLAALKRKGFEEPTLIQTQTIPLLLRGDLDIVAQAQTGTGKTAAFGLALIENLDESARCVQALILVPTRELAIQVAEEINSLKGKKHLSIIAIYGGQSMDQQLRHLHKGVDVVVGTPGRVKDHLQRKSLKIDKISYAILDEADEMLNMGFIDDVEEILGYSAAKKRVLLFSATIPRQIISLAEKYMGKYKFLRTHKEQLTVELTDQIYFEVAHSDKLEALCRIIDSEANFYGLVFCRTRIDVDNLVKKLVDRGYDTEGLHGDISQSQRERILGKFKAQRINVLIATDVAARGIDISDLSHVINYSLPQDPRRYVHRIGRTGRAGKGGTAITFVTPDEYRKLILIKRFAKTDIRKEKIPDVADVINSKKARIKSDLNQIINSASADEYLDFAREILENADQEKVVAAFIKHSFGDELSAKSYGKIRDVSRETSVDMEGTARLFVAKGKNDNFGIRGLLDMIKQISGVSPHKVRDVRMFDKFSFITVSFEDAEVILRSFKEERPNRRPIVQRAKEIEKKKKY